MSLYPDRHHAQEIEQLQRENAELRAHVERLCEAILASGTRSYGAMKLIDAQEIALNQAPTQSLHAHDMEVAERVREACADKVAEYYGTGSGSIALRNLDLSEAIKDET